MHLILVRHGIAVDPAKYAASGGAEPERPLTERGIKRAKRAARGLRRVVDRIDLIATSPYNRAVQTAEIFCHALKKSDRPKIEPLPALAPGSMPKTSIDWLRQQDQNATIALVGHEPDMSRLLSVMTTGNEIDVVRFGKAGAALLQCRDEVVEGGCELLWFLPPSILRRLGV